MRILCCLLLLNLLFSCKKKEEPAPEPAPLPPVVVLKGSFTGKVNQVNAFGQSDTTAISEIKITLLPSGANTRAATNGTYALTEVTAGTYTLVYEKTGYGTILNPAIIYKPGDQGSFNATLARLPTFSIASAYVKDTTWFSTQIPGIYYRAATTETAPNGSAIAIISNTGTPIITDINSYQNYPPVSVIRTKDDYNRFLSYSFLKDTYGYKKGQIIKIRIYPVAASNGSYIVPKENRPLYTAYGPVFAQTFTLLVP